MFESWKFDDKRADEKVLISVKRHPIVLLKGLLMILLLIAIGITVIVFFKISWISLISTIIVLVISLLVSFYYLYIWYNDLYILTDSRLIDVDQMGIFTRTVSESDLDQIQEVKVEVKGPLETALGFGTVTVQTAGPKQNIVLEVVPNPYNMENVINKAVYESKKNKLSNAGNLSKGSENE